MSENFFKKNIQQKHGDPIDTSSWLVLKAANGLDIPYIGYVEIDITVNNQVFTSCGVLIEKDIPETREKKNVVPGCLGMNVLRQVPDLQQLLPRVEATKTSTTVKTTSSRTRFARIAGTDNVRIPADSICEIVVSGKPGPEDQLIEPLTQPLPKGLILGRSFVRSTNGRFVVRITNPTGYDVYLKPGVRVGTMQVAEIVEADTVEFVESSSRVLTVQSKSLQKGSDQCTSSPGPDLHAWITESVDLSELPVHQRGPVVKLLEKHSTIFAANEDELGLTKAVKHRIPTVDDVPVAQPYRRIPPSQLDEVKDHIRQMLRRGIIRESSSPYASPMVLVRKKSGKLRICIDYRLLNKKTRRDAYPLPRVEESLDVVAEGKWFSTIDLQSAYNQVEVEEDDKQKTAFCSPLGLYEYNRMPFGLNNAPATFQRLMQNIFREEFHDQLAVYLDDIIVFSRTYEQHLERLELVFSRLAQYGLKVEPAKCHLFRQEVKFLGHSISSNGIAPNPDLVSTIENWPIPNTAKELRSFVSTAGYYRRYVRDFSRVASPLHALIQQDPAKGCKPRRFRGKKSKPSVAKPVEFIWTDACQAAFDELKRLLTSAPILGYADFKQSFFLETDACATGLGAVLYQHQDGHNRVIAYASRGLRGSERNEVTYSSMKLELLALKWAICDKFRQYLLGSHVTVYTDNNPLCYLQTSAKLGATEQRWSSQLAQFDFDIKYRPGKHNQSADGLSRKVQSDFSEVSSAGQIAEIGNLTVVPDEIRKILIQTTIAHVFANEVGCPDSSSPPRMLGEIETSDLILMQREDPVLSRVWHYKDQELKPTRSQQRQEGTDFRLLMRSWDKMQDHGGVLYRVLQSGVKQQLVPQVLQEKVLTLAHDKFVHQGIDRCEKLIRSRCYWPRLSQMVQDWVSRCERCTLAKMPNQRVRTPMKSIVATRPLQILAIDYTVLEKASNGQENILVMTDVNLQWLYLLGTRPPKQPQKSLSKTGF